MIQEKILAELKAQHPETALYVATIDYKNEHGVNQTTSVVYRKPTVAEIGRLQTEAQRDPAVATSNMFVSIIIKAEDDKALQALREYPLVMDRFLSECVFPLCGSGAVFQSRKVE